MERAALAVVREPTVEIVVPVFNEERDLERGVRRLRSYLDASFPFHSIVTIADNASDDQTGTIGARLAATVPGVRYMRISERGRGRALAAAWLISDADVVAYTDVDLSSDLDALLPLVAPLISGHSDIAIGSRLLQRPAASRARREVQRRAVRLQGRAHRHRATHRPASREPVVVFRHRDAGARTAGGSSHPRGACRLGRRCRLAGRSDPHGGRGPARSLAAHVVGTFALHQVHRGRHHQHDGLRPPLPVAARGKPGLVRERGRKVGSYYFRDIVLNPEFPPGQFERAALTKD